LKEEISQEGKERQISGVFKAIPDNAESEEAYSEEKMRKIKQALVQYKEKNKELEECTVPMTPPLFRAQRDKDATIDAENIA
jgi:hypothetical protein